MEEISHIHLGHKPSKFTIMDGLLTTRSYNKSQEKQAFCVGSAALVPSALLRHAKSRGISKKNLADKCGVSHQLASMRENITGIKLS